MNTTFAQTLPITLWSLVNKAYEMTDIQADTPSLSISLIDHTSLEEAAYTMVGSETTEDILTLCEAAKDKAAAVCVYPNHASTASNFLDSSTTKVAIVHNFPHGDNSLEHIKETIATFTSINCDEIDTVIDYQAFLKGDIDACKEKLLITSAASHAAKKTLKVILKASVYENYQSLYDAAILACECGADFVKTCTGKLPKSGFGNGSADISTLLTGATVLQAVSDYNKAHPKTVGVKISGGVKTAADCEKYRYLVQELVNNDFYCDTYFRFGASSLLPNLINGTESTTAY
ncbi:hypothetical protein QGN29_09230 [Temperatibacter marinus]|uniref:deoxyribose-phosphate aldolase n=1 Tax=Temperatibacter marinus TaxID=1456591 RepID=A0AA52EF84_9PROT|nr:hypothetical protein [Temperatibacter marinus]WND01735.1 hypothetical protein QGN29_09230 [Temperatibacter marinus]